MQEDIENKHQELKSMTINLVEDYFSCRIYDPKEEELDDESDEEE